MAVEAQIVVAREADQALAVTANDAMAYAVARLEKGYLLAAVFHVLDAAAKRPVGRKVVDDALAFGLIGFSRNVLLLGGRRMGRHCPSVYSLACPQTAGLAA